MAGIRASEHFPRCLGVIPDGPSHRFADPVRHRPAMTIAMLTIGSSRGAGRYLCRYLRLQVPHRGSDVALKYHIVGVTWHRYLQICRYLCRYLSKIAIFGKYSNCTHFASCGLGWTPTDIRHLPATWTTSLEPFMTPFSQVLDLILESLQITSFAKVP